MPRSRHPVLSAEALNRATLARQRLLERADLDPVTAAGELAGLQAQEPASPYLALWARLRAFAPADLDRAFRDRRLVKATLMRSTLHVVPRADYLALRPALASSLTAVARRVREGRPDDDRHARMTASALALAREPRSNTELRDHVAALAPDLPAEDAWWWVRRQAPLVHAPVDAPWSFGRRPALVDAAAWLGGEPFGTEVDGLGLIVRRHLAAFGPASAADVSAWSGLPVGRLRPAIAAIEDTGLVRRFADERGRELLDLDGAPLPDPATPAPARLLPMWDGLLLAHADRTRVVSDADRASVIGVNGDTYPTLLVDGRVAGLWWVEPGDGGRPRVILEPFRALPAGARRDLEAEGERLAAFVADVEPRVYARYRASRARRAARREHP